MPLFTIYRLEKRDLDRIGETNVRLDRVFLSRKGYSFKRAMIAGKPRINDAFSAKPLTTGGGLSTYCFKKSRFNPSSLTFPFCHLAGYLPLVCSSRRMPGVGVGWASKPS